MARANADPTRWKPRALTLALAATLVFSNGCSIRKLAVNSLAGALSGRGDVFTSDEDPELVRDALPFALKTFETLLAESPDNVGLLVTTCKGFLLYGYAFVELEAERLELESYRAAQAERDRALKLYLRAREYCFRALDLEVPGAREALMQRPEEALAGTRAEHLEVLYWNAMAWGAAIALGLDQPELSIDLPAVRTLFERCLELDPDYDRGALHDAMIALDGLPEHMGGSLERAREHYQRALELNRGQRAGTHVAWAASISLRQQDRHEFERLLGKALEVDPDARESERLVNLIAQRRARFLLDQVDDLFLDDLEDLEDLEDPEDVTDSAGQP